jgi:tRNA1Val (adenine37-N6)-methyltransferase
MRNAERILDIGAGSGVIALMLAQRSNERAHIDAVEIEQQDAQQALENVEHSPWPHKISIHKTPIQEFFPPQGYDLIISNPPYFVNSFEPPDQRRHQTRHTVSLSFSDLLFSVKRLLKPEGAFNVILPYTEGLHFTDLAAQCGLHCSRKWSFRTRAGKRVERWLMEFTYAATSPENGEVLLYQAGSEWSDGYKQLTRDFYLAI